MTKFIKEKDIDKAMLHTIAQDIRSGKLVVFKTDTVYGIGTNAYLEEACKRIYEVKGRPEEKPLCVLISDNSMLDNLVFSINLMEQKLIDTFWPGPPTMKFKKKENILPNIISAGDDFVRVRLVKSGFAHLLIKEAGVPIVAPSANLSSNPTGIVVNNIVKELDGKVDYIIDSGDICDDTTSTIVSVVDGEAIIIRDGKIKGKK